MAKQVSTTYGEALFELAMEENKIDDFFAEAQALFTVFAENEEMVKLLRHPKVLKEDKIAFVENVFEGQASEAMVGFLTIIIKKDRQSDIPSILEYFIKRVKDYKQIGVAEVTSAVALTEEQKSKVQARLLETTDFKSVEVSYKEDSALIGGMVIRIADRVVDSSIRTQLSTMKQTLLKA
ncbi:MAG: F0F1 ATP synthase subunit delta [Lachnospiraceae bacterium]|nr:F0F1 ATP synthase subunit delta [Lachnospiraceae bacterium]